MFHNPRTSSNVPTGIFAKALTILLDILGMTPLLVSPQGRPVQQLFPNVQ